MKKVAAAMVILAAATVLVVPFHPEAFLLHALDGATPRAPLQERINWIAVESGGNLTMFALLGAALWVFLRRPLRATLLGIGISGAAELAQIVIPHRVPSVTDFITNAVGAALGAIGAHLIARISQAGRTAPEGRPRL